MLTRGPETSIEGLERLLAKGPETSTRGAQPIVAASPKNAANSSEDLSRVADPFPFIAWRRKTVWPTAIELAVLAFTECRMSVDWFDVSKQPRSKRHWLPV